MKILIIDDEPTLASVLAQQLETLGIPDCSYAVGASAGLDAIMANPEIGLVITDVVMAETDGFTLRDSLAESFPHLKFIFISGYDLSAYAERVGNTPLLLKPVEMSLLMETIKDVSGILPVRSVPTPVATPRAVVAAPAVSPKAVAVSQPKAVASPVPKPAQVVTNAPRAVARPSAVPSAVPVAKPKVAAAKPAVAARPVAAKAVASVPAAAPELPADEHVGTQIGDYHIEAKIGEDRNGSIYCATQTGVKRAVRLHTLSAENAAVPERLGHFISNARVKANVRHPAMLAVYEANQSGGVNFFAGEHVDGTSLDQVESGGLKIPALTAVKILEMTSDVMAYFGRDKVKHNPLRSSSILLDGKGNPRLANIAVERAESEIEPSEEMASLAAMLLPLLAPGPLTPAVESLLQTMLTPETAPPSWPVLGQQAHALVPKSAPTDAYKLDARERAAIQALEAAKKSQKKTLIMSSLFSLGLLAIILVVAYFVLFSGSSGKAFDKMIEIPAGPFIYQDGETITLPGFWTDQYEVTISQYAQFLEWAKANPEEAAKIAHPEMPKGKSFEPLDWGDQELATGPMMGYYTRAKRWGKYKGAPLNVDSPVFGLDWYDAYAYAAWKGRRLPTEQEWEKAARGKDGLVFPWGNENNTKIVNSGADANRNPDAGGEIDGYSRWSPVDAMSKDRSPYDVMGMGGNVSEWTATYDESPELSGDKVPVIRGGNWANPDVDTRRRLLKLMPLQQDLSLGFRTASDTPPPKP
jgi:formylglycine-generating enzyme required for sulfatase activity/CheY-like chemotaxis protein